MIKKENKLIQITLDPESLSLLNSLAERFHISKTETIKQALKLYGANKKHHYSVYLNNKEIEKKSISEMIQDIENKGEDISEEDSLPFK